MPKAFLRAAFLPALLFVALAVVLQGCGSVSPDDVVAKVNEEEITVAYFELKWSKLAQNDPKFRPKADNEDSLRHAVLDIIINKELILDRAKKDGFLEDPGYINNYNKQRDYRLVELLKNKEIVDKIPEYSEEDIRAHYAYVGQTAKARHIVLDSEAEALDIYKRINAGDISFEEAVEKHSTAQDKDKGGTLNPVAFGSSIEPVENALFNMEVGAIHAPVETPQGWSILILDQIKEDQEKPEYGAVQASIKQRLEMRAMREIGAQHATQILEKYGFEFDWDVAELVAEHMPPDPTMEEVQDPRSRTEEKPILKFDEDQLKLVLYKADGESHDLQEFSDEYDRLHLFARPQKVAGAKGVHSFIHKQVVADLIGKEALAIGLDKDPEFVLTMKNFSEQFIINAVRAAVVDRPINITEADAKVWFEENPKYYTLRRQVRCKQLITAEEEEIREAYRRLGEGESFDDVGKELAINFTRQWETELFTPDSTLQPDNLAVIKVARLHDVGEYTDPFYLKGYWAIMQISEKHPQRIMEWDEAKDRAMKDLKDQTSNARLDSFLVVWRDESAVEINEKVLSKTKKGPDPNPNREKY